MLTRPHSSQITTGTQALDTYLGDRGQVADPYFRSIVAEVPFRNSDYDTLVSTYGYTTLYPQCFAFDDVAGECFILRTTTASGDNSWGWIFVYDAQTWAHKRTFTLGIDWSESLVIRWNGSTRYLYTLAGSGGNVYRADITTLPTNLGTVTSTDMGVAGYTQMTFNGDLFSIQSPVPFKGGARRNRFDLYDATLTTFRGRVEFPRDMAGDLGDYAAETPKTQMIAFFDGIYAFGAGGDYVEGADNPVQPRLQCGIQLCSTSGEKLVSALCRPDRFHQIMATALGKPCNMVENEGVAVYQGRLHALWMLLTPDQAILPENAGRGIIITREMSTTADRIDFRAAATTTASFDVTRVNSEVAQNLTASLIDPLKGTAIDSFADIVAYMRGAGLSRYSFAGTGQTLVDINGATVDVAGDLVICHNVNGSSFLIECVSAVDGECRLFWLTSNGTSQVTLLHPRFLHRSGTGTPEGAVTAPIGTLYSRLDGGASTTLYVKESGTGNTGWVAK